MRKKLVVLWVLVMVATLHLGSSAQAHFFIEDSSTNVKAYFHVTPDHNPVAGENSVISYDFSKSGISVSDFSFELSAINEEDGKQVSIPFTIAGNGILADYTFPYQGLYKLMLSVENNESSVISSLTYSQRVFRGNVQPAEHANWLPIIGILTGSIVLVIAAIIFDRRGYNTSKNKAGGKVEESS